MINVALLGAGNVATHLFEAFFASKSIEVLQWYNRSIDSIKSFENKTEVIDDLDRLKEADMYILALRDDAIASISQQLPFSDRFVVHTSGSVNIHDLDRKNSRGVFYPLQTFSKSAPIDFKNVPFCVECEDKSRLHLLTDIATAIGSPSYKLNTEQRQTLHLSAVFVNNFTNQLYRIAHEISDAKNINFDILKPLITETAHKVQELSPYMAQTGPAKRNDKKTINRHLKQLEKPQHKEIYELLTRSIQDTHGISTPKSKSKNRQNSDL